MLLLFFLYLLLCLYKLRPHLRTPDPDYMTPERTQSIKGIFILLVFFSHFNAFAVYDGAADRLYASIVRTFGQCMVAPFFFLSGYGIMESIRRRGPEYVRQIPKNRVLRTLFPFAIAVIVFGLTLALLGYSFPLRIWLPALIGWYSLGNSNWYIFVAVLMYLFTYISFRLLAGAKRCEIPAAGTALLAAAYVFLMAHFGWKDYYWYDTALCYPLGIFFSLWRTRIEKLLAHDGAYFAAAAALIAAAAAAKYFSANLYADIACMLLFAMAVTVVTMRVTIGNRALRWAGEHLFQIYILQKLPMILLAYFGFLQEHPALSFCISLTVTLLLAEPFRKAAAWLWSVIAERS